MSEFKGTKGKWLYDHAQEAILSENLHIIADIFPPHNMENALLISKAPEMLEMLIEIRDQIEDGRTYITKEDINKLIKSATET